MTAFEIVSLVSFIVLIFMVALALFGPTLRYKIRKAPAVPLDAEEFRRMVEVLADATIYDGNRIEVLTNGEAFYPAQIEAIRKAEHSVNLEAYLFQRGRVTAEFLEALADRARAGCKVHVVIDAVGSLTTPKSYFKPLLDAGGEMHWYHPLRWDTWPRFNNRTHREIIVIDGKTGFVGGPGFADHWLYGRRKHPRWRDTAVRVNGPVVAGLQATFAENWLEASGEILTGKEHFPLCPEDGPSAAMAVNSSPSAGESTRARMLFQTMIAAARRYVHITTPYFLPDRSVRAELVRAVRERGVEVKVITPGHRADHLLTRRSSRRLYGQLLEAGVRIFEYEPSMIHTKSMVIDGVWGIVGSTNFDHRSFLWNDELNLAAADEAFAQRLDDDFARDLQQCHEVKFEQWRRRPIWERAHEWLGWMLERQQ